MSPNRRIRRYLSSLGAFTVVELLVIIVVIGVLAGIILPSLNKARIKANASQCVDQYRQLGQAYAEYIADHQIRLFSKRWLVISAMHGNVSCYCMPGRIADGIARIVGRAIMVWGITTP